MLNSTAVILRVSGVTTSNIGEKIPKFSPIGSTKIRLFNKDSMYIRTAVGYVAANQKSAIIPYKTDIKQGDKIEHNEVTYLVVSKNDDAMGIYMNLTLEQVI